jgi:hypothetical protein
VIAAVVTAAIIVMVNRNEQAPINGTGPIVIVP